MPIYLGDTEVNKVYLGANSFDNIQNGVSELWSNVSLSSITTNSISSIGATNLTLNGNITNDGGGTITDRGFYFGTSTTYTSNTKISLGAGTAGSYSLARTGLSQYSTYYSNAYAVNGAGETVGGQTNATTSYLTYFQGVAANQSFNMYFYDSSNTLVSLGSVSNNLGNQRKAVPRNFKIRADVNGTSFLYTDGRHSSQAGYMSSVQFFGSAYLDDGGYSNTYAIIQGSGYVTYYYNV